MQNEERSAYFVLVCLISFLHILSRVGHKHSPVGEVQYIKCTSSFLLQIDYLNWATLK